MLVDIGSTNSTDLLVKASGASCRSKGVWVYLQIIPTLSRKRARENTNIS
ncbi:MAG: hypothetical protein ACYC27_03470 [Armatimonadota bacterium]